MVPTQLQAALIELIQDGHAMGSRTMLQTYGRVTLEFTLASRCFLLWVGIIARRDYVCNAR